MSRNRSVIGLGLLLLAACQLNPATAPPPAPAAIAATATLAPPTATGVLPATATLAGPTATATNDPLATGTPTPAPGVAPDPELGVGATLFEENFDGSSGWEWAFSDAVATFSLGDGRLNAVMARSDSGWRASGGPEIEVRDAQLRLTSVVNLCYENDEYGLLFRSKVESGGALSGYLFKLTCGGQVRVESLRSSQPSVLIDWTTPAFVHKSENVFMIWAARDRLNFYLNERFIGTINDRTHRQGGFGVYLRDRTAGGASVSFTRLTIREVVAP